MAEPTPKRSLLEPCRLAAWAFEKFQTVRSGFDRHDDDRTDDLVMLFSSTAAALEKLALACVWTATGQATTAEDRPGFRVDRAAGVTDLAGTDLVACPSHDDSIGHLLVTNRFQ